MGTLGALQGKPVTECKGRETHGKAAASKVLYHAMYVTTNQMFPTLYTSHNLSCVLICIFSFWQIEVIYNRDYLRLIYCVSVIVNTNEDLSIE